MSDNGLGPVPSRSAHADSSAHPADQSAMTFPVGMRMSADERIPPQGLQNRASDDLGPAALGDIWTYIELILMSFPRKASFEWWGNF